MASSVGLAELQPTGISVAQGRETSSQWDALNTEMETFQLTATILYGVAGAAAVVIWMLLAEPDEVVNAPSVTPATGSWPRIMEVLVMHRTFRRSLMPLCLLMASAASLRKPEWLLAHEDDGTGLIDEGMPRVRMTTTSTRS